MILPAVRCLVPGSPGRHPFAGHVRGAREAGALRVAWAGRIAATASPEEAWEAADALRDVFLAADATARAGVIAAVGAALATIPARWLDRGDLSVLLAVADEHGIALMGCGWSQVLVETSGGWMAAALPGSPLIGDPGLPAEWAGPQPPLRAGVQFLGLPGGLTLPADPLRGCGVRT